MTTGNRKARVPRAVGTRHQLDARTIRPCHWIAIVIALFIASCAAPDTRHQVVISTRDQKVALLDRGNLMAVDPVSTSKFGLGDWRGSRFTPLGNLQIAEKIGDNAAPGTVFKSRRRTGEGVLANSPGRDPIVTRIFWLRGLEAQNANAFGRDIYIHGTPEEWTIGSPASYRCVEMRTSSSNRTFGSQSRIFFAFDASPSSTSTSAGRSYRRSCFTNCFQSRSACAKAASTNSRTVCVSPVASTKSAPSPSCTIRHIPSTYSGAYPQSRFASRLPRNNSFCMPCLMAATAREILRLTKVSPRRGLSWLNKMPLLAQRP